QDRRRMANRLVFPDAVSTFRQIVNRSTKGPSERRLTAESKFRSRGKNGMDVMTYDRNEIIRNALAQAAAAEGKRLRRLDEALDANRKWHLVQISQQHFTKASFFLGDAGYTIYAPMVREFVIPKSSSLSLGQRRQRHLFKRERLSP